MFPTPAFSTWALANLPPPAVLHAPPGTAKVGLLLNCNARSVDAEVLARLRTLVGDAHVFASHSLEEAEELAAHVAAADYDVVACGGGDGTLADAINRVLRHREGLRCAGGPSRASTAPCTFAFVPFGTGNAMRHVVGSRDPYAELRALVRGRRFATRPLPLVVDQTGRRFFFGGLGYDSLVLHDYNRLLLQPRPAWTQPWVRSWAGYAWAVGRDTLPRLARGDAPLQVRVVSRGPAHYFDPLQGDAPVPLPEGSTLYAGDAGMLAVGTVPYFGYGMKVFPFAESIPGTWQLRVARLPAATVLAHLGGIWRGTYRNPTQLFDFAVRDVDVHLDRPFPFERCGDDGGPVDWLRLQLAPDRVHLVDFARPLQALS